MNGLDGSIRQADEPEQRYQCYDGLRQAIQQAVALAPLQWSGIAWMQGEEDSKHPGDGAQLW